MKVKIIMDEIAYDKLLKIKTTGRDDSNADQYRFPYEPTPYSVLERLANRGYIGKKNTLIDYGCGKGRVGLFLSYQTRCHSIGIEYDERIYAAAAANKENGVSGRRCEFALGAAERYAVPTEVDRFFLFNPFSVEVLGSVMTRISESYYESPREMLFFFYYPSEEYMNYLQNHAELELFEEIDCSDLFEGENPREKIAIYNFI